MIWSQIDLCICLSLSVRLSVYYYVTDIDVYFQGLPGSHVYLQFVDSFGIACHIDVCKDFVEVRYNSSLALTGARLVQDINN